MDDRQRPWFRPDRRTFLGAATVAGIAGCVGSGDDADDANDADDPADGTGDDGNGDENGDPATATFAVSVADTPATLAVDATLTVAYTVENTGDAPGTQAVRVSVDGNEIEHRDLTLEAGETESETVTYAPDVTRREGLEWDVSVRVATDDETVSRTVLVVRSPVAGGRDDVVAWNRTLLNVIRMTSETPTETVRRIAILTTAMYDAVATLAIARGEGVYEPYETYEGEPPAAGSPLAALGGAAEAALSRMYPGFSSSFRRRRDGTLSRAETLEDGEVSAGEEWGQTVGEQAVEHRADDGYDDPEPGGYDPCPGAEPAETPGCWRGGSLGTWRDSHYAFLDMWVLDGPLSFEGPPPLDSEAYADAWQEVYELGDRNREDRPDEWDDIATYWRGGAGTTRPSGRWLRITNIAIESGEFDLSLIGAARLAALVGLGLGEAGVTAWNGKHEWGFWRPAEAIAAGDTDGNPDTFADEDWQPRAIGSSPEYPAGLALHGSTSRTILVEELGTDDFSFEMRSSGPPAQIRSFDSFGEAMEESWMSRLYVGNHFRFALTDALEAGEEIGETVLTEALQPRDA